MKIVNFGQLIDVQARQMAHQIVVETEDGRQHMISTDEGTVQQLIGAITNSTAPVDPAHAVVDKGLSEGMRRQVEMRRANPEYDAGLRDSEDAFWGSGEQESDLEPGAEIFGGGEDPGETHGMVMGSISEEPTRQPEEESVGIGRVKPPPRVLTDSDGFALPVRSKTVPKDEMGYPIVSTPARRTGPWDEDESGDGAQI